MTILIVGTSKGAGIFSTKDNRKSWVLDRFVLQGWSVSAAARDNKGKTFLALCSDVYGPTIMTSDDLVEWTQTSSAPAYQPSDKGNHDHNRIIGARIRWAVMTTINAT